MRQERKRSGEMGRGKGEEDGFRGGEGRHGGWGVDSKRGRRFGGKVLKTFGVGRFVCGGKEEACAGWLREGGYGGRLSAGIWLDAKAIDVSRGNGHVWWIFFLKRRYNLKF